MGTVPRFGAAAKAGARRLVGRRRVVRTWAGATLAGLAVWPPPGPVAADHAPGPGAELDRFARAYCAAWSSGQPEQVAALYAPDARLEEVVSGGVIARGRGEVAVFAASLFTAFPGFAAAPRAGFADGGRAVVEWTLTGDWSDDGDRSPERESDAQFWLLTVDPTPAPVADIYVASVLDLADGAILVDRWYGPPFAR